MENTVKKELMLRLSDYIGAFAIVDVLRMIQPHHVQSFLSMENRLLEGINEAKRHYEESGQTDKNLYSLIIGAEAAIKAANDTIKADGKSYCYSMV